MARDVDAPPRKGFVEEALRAANVEPPPPRGAPEFMINRQSAVPLHIQIKEQIRYAIMSGDLQPGTPLPSIRDLTKQLGVHRNTVHRVYLELQAAGLLASRPGIGVFVNEALAQTISVSELNAVDAMVERFFEEANAKGINPITLSTLMGQRAPAWDAKYPTVAFVECTAHQSAECAKDLGEAFGVRVVHLLLDDLCTGKVDICGRLKHVVTSVFHYDEVKAWADGSDRRVHAVAYGLHPATTRKLRTLGSAARLGFICHDANTEEVIGREVANRVSPGVFVGCANLEMPDRAKELIDEVDTLILTEPAAAFVVENATPDHELLELHFSLNPVTVEKVRRSVLFQP